MLSEIFTEPRLFDSYSLPHGGSLHPTWTTDLKKFLHEEQSPDLLFFLLHEQSASMC